MIRLPACLLVCTCLLLAPLAAQSDAPPQGAGAGDARPSAPATIDERKAEQLRELVERALEVRVEVNLKQTSKVVWSNAESRYTVPGIGVSMRLEEENLLVKLQLTPYRKQGDLIYLLIQGQVWIRSEANGTLQNFSTAKGTTVRLGEALTFYPLGIPNNPDAAVLAVFITVKPLDATRMRDVQDSLTRPKPPAESAAPPSRAPVSGEPTSEAKKPEGAIPRKP